MGTEDKWAKATRAVWSATRREAGLTQAQLADRLKWKRDRVAATEAGRRRISVGDLIQLAAACRVNAEQMFRRVLHW
jgi:transcriptional regulator with XRE-family HTH domain